MFRWLDDIPFAPGMAVWFLLMVGGAWVADSLYGSPPPIRGLDGEVRQTWCPESSQWTTLHTPD